MFLMFKEILMIVGISFVVGMFAGVALEYFLTKNK